MEGSNRGKRALEDEEDGNSDSLSKNKQKKKLRNPNKTFDPSLKRKIWGSEISRWPKANEATVLTLKLIYIIFWWQMIYLRAGILPSLTNRSISSKN